MNCEQANHIDLVEYLFSVGFSPRNISKENYWYLSPLHVERTASFKVNRLKNIWYDHALGKGGKLVDFACLYLKCSISDVLDQLVNSYSIANSSSHQQKSREIQILENDDTIRIISSESPISTPSLINYINHRNIDLDVANKFCREIHYKTGEYTFSAIGFKNSSGGYELRSPNFKGAVSPKYVTWFDNKASSISVFEGFFDFLSYGSVIGIQKADTNILVLNSLSFFTRSLLLMEKHERIHLFLDNDKAGKACVQQALNRTEKVIDESDLYKGHKDLNEWLVTMRQPIQLRQSRGLKR